MNKLFNTYYRWIFILNWFSFGNSYYIAFENGIDECKNLCADNFFLLPVDKNSQIDCQRGCRFFFLIDFQNNHNVNTSKEECFFSCRESYINIQERGSCTTGCNIVMNRAEAVPLSLIPLFDRPGILLSDQGLDDLELSDPIIKKELGIKDGHDYHIPENYIKTMPIIKYNQLETNLRTFNFEEKVGDWLECASKNSGIPKWLLIFAIFVAVLAVILLSFSSDKVEFENEFMDKMSDTSLLITKESKDKEIKDKEINKEIEASAPPMYCNKNVEV